VKTVFYWTAESSLCCAVHVAETRAEINHSCGRRATSTPTAGYPLCDEHAVEWRRHDMAKLRRQAVTVDGFAKLAAAQGWRWELRGYTEPLEVVALLWRAGLGVGHGKGRTPDEAVADLMRRLQPEAAA